MLRTYQGQCPQIHETAFIEESAQIIGDVQIGRDSSVWFQAVVRGDVHSIRIGERSNIQDGAILHGTLNRYPVVIADHVTIGHRAIVHGATVRSNCLIGMGAIILDDATIGSNCIVGAGAVVAEGKTIPPNSLVLGVPGRIVRSVTPEEVQRITAQALRYVEYKNVYRHASAC